VSPSNLSLRECELSEVGKRVEHKHGTLELHETYVSVKRDSLASFPGKHERVLETLDIRPLAPTSIEKHLRAFLVTDQVDG